MNLCCACGEDFSSVAMFDRHRVGVHAYDYAEGLAMTPSREDGRRCLDTDEMCERGWTLNKHGRWHEPPSASERKRLSALQGRSRTPREGSTR